MTVSTSTNQVVLDANGVTTVFPFEFKVLEQDHLTVERRDVSTGLVDKTYTTSEYTLVGLGDDAGSVTISPAPADGYAIIITRTVPYTQETDIVNQGGFYPDVVEAQFDLHAMGLQQLDTQLARAILVAPGEEGGELPAAEARAGLYLAFDANGDPTVSSGTGADAGLRTDLASAGGPALIGMTAGGSFEDWIVGMGGVSLNQFGGGLTATGVQNSQALGEAMTYLINLGDTRGDIHIPPGDLLWDNVVLPANTEWQRPIKIFCHSTRLIPSDPQVGVFMWDFDNGSGATGLEIYGALVAGDDLGEFNGIRVGASNKSKFQMDARFVDGIAFEFVRPFNAEINTYTLDCGPRDYSAFAVEINGGATSSANWLRLMMTSERDYNGINIENAGLIETTSRMKLHGSYDADGVAAGIGNSHTRCMLRLNRVTDFRIGVLQTQGFSQEGAIQILDASNSAAIAPRVASSQGGLGATRGTLDYNNYFNAQYYGAGTAAMVVDDLAYSTSNVAITGKAVEHAAWDTDPGTQTVEDVYYIGLGSTIRYLRHKGPGASNTFIDTSDFVMPYSDPFNRIIDSRTLKTTLSLPRIGNPTLRPETTVKATGIIDRMPGEVFGFAYDGTATIPPRRGMGHVQEFVTRGALLGYDSIDITSVASINATTQVLWPTWLNIGGDATAQVVADLESVILRGDGFPASWLPVGARYYFDIYLNGVLKERLNIHVDAANMHAVAGDGQPGLRYTNATYGDGLKYWAGRGMNALSSNRFVYSDVITAQVTLGGGAPAALTNFSAKLNFIVRL